MRIKIEGMGWGGGGNHLTFIKNSKKDTLGGSSMKMIVL